MKQRLIVFIEQFLFVIGYIRSLAMPCHQHLGQNSIIDRPPSVLIGRALLPTLSDEEPIGYRVSKALFNPTITLSLLRKSRGFTAVWEFVLR